MGTVVRPVEQDRNLLARRERELRVAIRAYAQRVTGRVDNPDDRPLGTDKRDVGRQADPAADSGTPAREQPEGENAERLAGALQSLGRHGSQRRYVQEPDGHRDASHRPADEQSAGDEALPPGR